MAAQATIGPALYQYHSVKHRVNATVGSMPKKGSKSGKKTTELVERRRYALELRKAGNTYERIARALKQSDRIVTPRGYNRSLAFKDVMHELDAIREESAETAREVKEVVLQQLDEMVRANWANMLAGDERSAGVILKCMDRQARLLGLDEPEALAIKEIPGFLEAKRQIEQVLKQTDN